MMPNITLNTLDRIQGIDPQNEYVSQQAMNQNRAQNNLCGAYATVAALGSLGIFPVSQDVTLLRLLQEEDDDINNPGVDLRATISPDHDFHQLSNLVYTVTGILNPLPKDANTADPVPVVPELIAGGGYNSPAAMAWVAIQLGTRVGMGILKTGSILQCLYPGEQGRCKQVIGENNINLKAVQYAPPKDNQINLVCVSSRSGLHWLAQSSNGAFYDPADGSINQLSKGWQQPKKIDSPVANINGSYPRNYRFAGLWLVIQDNSTSKVKTKKSNG